MLESCNWEMPVTTFNQDTDSRGRRVFFYSADPGKFCERTFISPPLRLFESFIIHYLAATLRFVSALYYLLTTPQNKLRKVI